MKALRFLGMIFLSAGLVLGGFYIIDLHRSQTVADELRLQKLQNTPPEPIPSQPNLDPTSPTPTPTPQPTLVIQANPFIDLFRQNNDLVGWLKIDNTRIDYPVVKGRDNDFYLTHGFDREKSRTGAIYMDYRNIGDGSDPHTVIYGHNMLDKSMFSDLLYFRDPEFYASRRIVTLETLFGSRQYKVFAAYTTSTDFYFIRTRFDETSFTNFIDEIQQRSDHEWEVPIAYGDQLLTLVTCAYDFFDARYVVHAVLLDHES